MFNKVLNPTTFGWWLLANPVNYLTQTVFSAFVGNNLLMQMLIAVVMFIWYVEFSLTYYRALKARNSIGRFFLAAWWARRWSRLLPPQSGYFCCSVNGSFRAPACGQIFDSKTLRRLAAQCCRHYTTQLSNNVAAITVDAPPIRVAICANGISDIRFDAERIATSPVPPSHCGNW